MPDALSPESIPIGVPNGPQQGLTLFLVTVGLLSPISLISRGIRKMPEYTGEPQNTSLQLQEGEKCWGRSLLENNM